MTRLPRNPSGKVLKRLLREERLMTGETWPARTGTSRSLRRARPIALITLNRPRYRNAQNSAMTYALDARLRPGGERRRRSR